LHVPRGEKTLVGFCFFAIGIFREMIDWEFNGVTRGGRIDGLSALDAIPAVVV